MRTLPVVRHALAAGGLFALAMLGACSDQLTTPSATTKLAKSGPSAALTAADLVVAGPDGGAFTNLIVADNSGWATTEFWDNPSDDLGNCNIGYFALGTIDAGCTSAATGSYANRGGGYVKYWGDGPTDRQASSFMFDGAYAYVVTLQGSYAVETSELGWFTVTGGVYTFHPVPGWGDKITGSSVIVPPVAGANWGIYLRHSGHPAAPTCAPNTDCSDATGDLHTGATPVQQFALMTNAAGDRYLIGVEDNAEELATIPGDDDFNDYILSVAPLAVPMFVIGDVEAHAIGDAVNFWGAQWWKNNAMSGVVSSGVAAFKGYATSADNFCGGTWSSLPGNSPPPPATIGQDIAIIVTSRVVKAGSAISGDIVEILIVRQDGGYGPSPGHDGNGTVLSVTCPLPPI